MFPDAQVLKNHYQIHMNSEESHVNMFSQDNHHHAVLPISAISIRTEI